VKAVTEEIGRLASLAAAGAEWIGLAEGHELWPATDSAASTGDAHATAIESPPGKAAAVIPANWTAGWDFVFREAVEERRTNGYADIFFSDLSESETDFRSSGSVAAVLRFSVAACSAGVQGNFSASVTPFPAIDPTSGCEAVPDVCVEFVRKVLPAFTPEPEAGTDPEELVSPVCSAAEADLCPNSASSDCQPVRKSCPAEIVDEEKIEAAPPAVRRLGAAP
jgi:hypothetical protein